MAKITKAYNLPCDYVIHTVGPIWNGGNSQEEELLASCYYHSLSLAEQHGIRTIAFPSISTGVYCFPVELAAKVAVSTVAKYLENSQALDLVEWVLFDEHTEKVYEREVDRLYDRADEIDEEYIAFIFENQEMTVLATASSEHLGFGMNVSMDGEYTQDEPVYTNANILNETFTEEELSVLQTNIPEEYYNDFFLFATTSGVVTDTKLDNGDRIIEAFVPTMGGYGYVLTITNEKDCTITFEDEMVFHFSF